MSVFISYSSKDKDFVEKLSLNLIQNRVNIWLDKWVMQPGDSLIDKIQSGINDSSFLLVVLSDNSVESKWCEKELNSGLMRELEEKEVVVIPVLIDNCKVPLFLKEKIYADFRTNFEKGFEALLRPLQKLISEHMGRIKNDDFTIDYAISWGIDKITEKFVLEIDIVHLYEKDNKTVLLQIRIDGDENATKRFKQQCSIGLSFLMKETLLFSMKEIDTFKELNILIQCDKIDPYLIKFKDEKANIEFDIKIRGVLMGEDNRNDMVINFIEILDMISPIK